MSELDLDELDQAVSKLMEDAGKPKPKKDDSSPVAVTSVSPSPAPADTPNDTVPVTVRSAAPSTAALSIAPRKKGIAMDIVQPKPVAVAPPSARTARTAPTLQPSKPVEPEVTQAEPEPTPNVDLPVSPPAAKEPAAPADADVSDDMLASINMQTEAPAPKPNMLDKDAEVHKSVWPDPLEVHDFKADNHDIHDSEQPSTPPPPEKEAMQHTAAPVVPPSATEGDDKTADEPGSDVAEDANSPFLTTKVEKRPLGAYADTLPEKPEAPKPEPVPEDNKAVEAANVPVQETPKELSAEVVAVESAEPEFTPDVPAAPAPEPEPEKPEDKLQDTDMDNLRQMAIPQQYHAAEKEPSKTERPVFDTKEYHTPLEIPATTHHTSHAGLIFTIILIVLMVAAAAGAYFVATGTIDLTRIF